MDKIYDVIIVGSGPAGIAAAIYAKRAGREVLVLEKFAVGGQLGLIGEIENYPGFSKISGSDLAEHFHAHAKALDIEIRREEVTGYNLSLPIKEVICRKQTYKTYAVVLALGSHPKELNIDGEEKFKGRGVSYCALCDGNFFKGKAVAVVGSGDSAFSDAIYLSSICSRVYILTKSYLKLHNYSEEELSDKDNVTILKNSISKRIEGSDKVEKLYYDCDGEEKAIDVDAVFVAIGRKPETENLQGQIEVTPNGYIVTDNNMQTTCEGVYACGDVRQNLIKQISTAVGEGTIAGTEASKYALRQKHLQTK